MEIFHAKEQFVRANADINVKPGILTHSLEILKRMVEEKAVNGEMLTGAILFDEMFIHKMLHTIIQ